MLLFPVLIFLAVGVYGLVHSFLASIWFNERLRRWFGPRVGRWYRLAYNIFATMSLLPVLALPVILPDVPLYTIAAPWIYFSVAGQIVAVVMLIAGLLQTGVWSFMGVRQLLREGSEPDRMVVSGLYRYVRHPLYTAGLQFIWLIPIMTVNILGLNLGLTAYLIVGALFEERKLRREFGQAYARYQEETPMLIPRWRAGK
jgi:protein-S-isoprenylcysteine O-methyltransferase Ste14